MKKKIMLSIMLSSVIFAGEQDQKKEAQSLEEAFKLAEVKGQLRAVYQSNSKLNGNKTADFLVGGKLGIETASLYGASLGATFYTSNTITNKTDFKDADYYNNNDKDYTFLGEAFARYSFKNGEIKAGRMELDTPIINSDDIRMIPDLYTAAMAKYSPVDKLNFTVGAVTQMAGWENGDDRTKFVPFAEVAKNHNEMSIFLSTHSSVKNSPLYIIGATYEADSLTANGWFGLIKDMARQYYAELEYTPIKNESLEFGVAAQNFIQQTDGQLDSYSKQAGNLGTRIASKIYGFKIFSTLPKFGADASFAINTSGYSEGYLHNGGTMYFWGGASDPLYTSTDVQTANAEGGVKAYKATIGLNLANMNLDGFKTQIAHAYFDKTKAASGNYAKETDFIISYAIGKASIEAIASNIQAKDTDNNNRLRVFAKYDF